MRGKPKSQASKAAEEFEPLNAFKIVKKTEARERDCCSEQVLIFIWHPNLTANATSARAPRQMQTGGAYGAPGCASGVSNSGAAVGRGSKNHRFSQPWSPGRRSRLDTDRLESYPFRPKSLAGNGNTLPVGAPWEGGGWETLRRLSRPGSKRLRPPASASDLVFSHSVFFFFFLL